MMKAEQKQEQVTEQLVHKFDDDKELVTEFVKQGYTPDELQKADITHPTKFDPIVELETGFVAGFWIEDKEDNHGYTSRTYKTRRQ